MNFESVVLSYASTFALVVARISGFVVLSPFPGNQVSRTQRIGLVAALTWVSLGFARPNGTLPPFDLRLGVAVATELGCGLVVGMAFQTLFFAAEIAGQMLSQGVGLSSPSTMNPTLGTQDMVLSRIVTLFALLFALLAGIHRIAIGMLLASFRALPIGSTLEFAPTSMQLIDLTIASFALGVALALPIIAVAFVVQLGLAMIARAAPALQIFSVGWGVLLATGSIILLASLRDLATGLTTHLGHLPAVLDTLFLALAGRS
jgi:flagellar biosynthetic protein FliR